MKLFCLFLIFFSSSISIFAYPIDNNINPWQTFLNLTDCHQGENNPILPDLKKYLQHFGYISTYADNFTDAFDDDLETALKTYQQNFHLDVTGILDLNTITQLMSPRCGVADIINGTSSMHSGKKSGRHLYEYFPGNPTWPFFKRQLTYAIASTSAVSADPSAIRSVFSRAFSRWSAATNLNFTEVASSDGADITIGFYSGDHGDDEPFDGVLGTLAHAFSPTDGRFHLDAAEDWVTSGDINNAGATAVDLESVAVHEIGHLLGLGHSSVEEAIMYPTIKTSTKKVELANDDVEGIQNLYGTNPTYGGVTPKSSTNQRDSTNDARSSLRSRGFGIGLILLIILLVF